MIRQGVAEGCELYEYECAICGKIICTAVPQNWAYKRTQGGKGTKLTYCCSWKCFRQLPQKTKIGGKSRKKEEIFELLRNGKSRSEIAEIVGVTRDTVRYWQDRFTG